MKLRSILLVLALLVPVASVHGARAPEPSAVVKDWQFDVELGPLRVVSLRLPDGSRRAYYYITYTVINETGQDLFFAPLIELATDQGEVMLAGRDVPLEVTYEIIRRQRNILLEDPIRILGRLQQGEENAKDGIAIWPVGKTNVDAVNLYFLGFSGETKTIKVRDAATGQMKDLTLWKTLMVRHAAPGELVNREAFSEGGRVLPRLQERWILRKPETIVTAPSAQRSSSEVMGANP